ncbi:hypothetical protein OHA21_43640 [Actinoplanes sp. NBC_00393]|uniref:hypothetical protein n=1 Tax=Actinoplanes sp. NBC_00393 TaxID=2975953 RepID=UPI002E2186BC
MTAPNVPDRETKRADELKPGDWLAAMQIADDGDQPSEVLNTFPYTDDQGPAVLLVWRAQDGVPRSIPADAHAPYELATQTDLDEVREQAERAKLIAERAEQIAGLRAFVDFLDRNSWAPMPTMAMQTSPNPTGDVWNSGPEGYAEVHRVADALGEKADERLDDRTQVSRMFGPVEYKVIAWHRDEGRPGAKPAEPEGLDFQREADPADELPVAGRRRPPHLEDGRNPGVAIDAAELVDEALAAPEHHQVRGWKDDEFGTAGVECACGTTYDNFSTLAEAVAELERHIEAANAEKPAEPVVRYYSFGSGQTDPVTGQDLYGFYVTVTAPTLDACASTMFASRFGNGFCAEYGPDSEVWQEYSPQWTELERITVTASDSGHLSPPSTTAPIGGRCYLDPDGLCTTHKAFHESVSESC